MKSGYGSSIKYIRKKYKAQHGGEWRGTDHHLRELARLSPTLAELIAEMAAADTSVLPDNPFFRPLGGVSDADLWAEIAKRNGTTSRKNKHA